MCPRPLNNGGLLSVVASVTVSYALPRAHQCLQDWRKTPDREASDADQLRKPRCALRTHETTTYLSRSGQTHPSQPRTVITRPKDEECKAHDADAHPGDERPGSRWSGASTSKLEEREHPTASAIFAVPVMTFSGRH